MGVAIVQLCHTPNVVKVISTASTTLHDPQHAGDHHICLMSVIADTALGRCVRIGPEARKNSPICNTQRSELVLANPLECAETTLTDMFLSF